MIANIDLIENRMILDFKDKKEFNEFIEFLEEAGYRVKHIISTGEKDV